MKLDRSIVIAAMILVVTAGLLTWRLLLPRAESHEDVHFHAGFVVFENSQPVDFSADQYMHIEECSLEEHQDTPEEDQIEKAHLHANVGDVVHVHREAAVWADLFANLNYHIDPASVSAYLNNQAIADPLSQPINPYDSLVLTVGETDTSPSNLLILAVTRDRIEAAEALTESCGN